MHKQAASIEKSMDEVKAAAHAREAELLLKIHALQRECAETSEQQTALKSEVEDLNNQVTTVLRSALPIVAPCESLLPHINCEGGVMQITEMRLHFRVLCNRITNRTICCIVEMDAQLKLREVRK